MPNLDRLVQQAIKNVYDRKIKAGQIDAALATEQAAILWAACAKGMGAKPHAFTKTELAAALRTNIYVFACFKNYHHVADLVGLLTDAQGKVRPWRDFRDLAVATGQKYIEHWLQTEYETAIASGQMAARWQDIQANRRSGLGMLSYETVGDDLVRKSHQLLDNVTLPIDDPFWDTYYPPNGFRCRCTVRQVMGPVRKPSSLPDDKEVPVQFRNNVGKSGQVFTPKHPYFSTVKPEVAERLYKAANKLMFDDLGAEWLKETEQARDTFRDMRNMPDDTLGYDKKTGGYIALHKQHSATGVKDEMPACELLRSKGHAIVLVDEVNPVVKYDLLWDGMLWDIKRLHKAKNFDGAFKDYFGKKKERLLIHIDMDIDEDILVAAINYAATRYPQVKSIRVLYPSGEYKEYTHEQMLTFKRLRK